MTFALFGLLMAGLAGAVWLWRRERARFQNMLAGSGLRDWIVQHAPPILADSAATDHAHAAASLMLRAVADLRNLKVDTGTAKGFDHHHHASDQETFGTHAATIRQGITYAALLVLLDDVELGTMFRRLLVASEDQAFTRAGTFAAGKPESPAIIEAFGSLPAPHAFIRGFEQRIDETAHA